MLRGIMMSELPRAKRLVLPKRNKQNGLLNRTRRLSLPARKELQTTYADQPARTKIQATKCSDYEPVDYCSPLFP